MEEGIEARISTHLNDFVRVIRVNKKAINMTVKHLEISLVLINRLPFPSLPPLLLWHNICLTDLAQEAHHLTLNTLLSAESFLPGPQLFVRAISITLLA
jgi:hypothetical protein